VALDPDTMQALREHRDTQVLEKGLRRGRLRGPGSRVRRQAGGVIYPNRLTNWFAEHRKAAGIPVHIVAARLGDDPKTVLGTYAHLLPQSDELAAERVAMAIAG